MLRIGLYGSNGHQIHHLLPLKDRATVTAHAACSSEIAEDLNSRFPQSREGQSLQDLLDDPEVDAISLCSPRRDEQVGHTLAALQAGKHVYAEKPCCFTEEELDGLVDEAHLQGLVFREMGTTSFEPPYWKIREVVLSGILGEVVQIYAQKSYPNHPGRPGDEGIDGGLVRQVGIHALRHIVQCTGRRILDIGCQETQTGLADRGDLRHAANLTMILDNSGLALASINYCNQRGFPSWGNETLRVWGTEGFVEATDGGTRTRLVIGEKDEGELDLPTEIPNDLSIFVDQILCGTPSPLSEEEELHPTRMILRAKAQAGGPELLRSASTVATFR